MVEQYGAGTFHAMLPSVPNAAFTAIQNPNPHRLNLQLVRLRIELSVAPLHMKGLEW